jgi:hypothetical protein
MSYKVEFSSILGLEYSSAYEEDFLGSYGYKSMYFEKGDIQ